jgi:hypothetical protein
MRVQFNFKAGGGTGADATWFYSYADGVPTTEYGTGLTNGYIFYYSEYHDCVGVSYGPYADGYQCTSGGGVANRPLAAASLSGIDDNQWHAVDISIRHNHITMRWDGRIVLEYDDVYTRDLEDPDYDNFGFAARTGGDNNNHYIKGLSVGKLGSNLAEYFINPITAFQNQLYWDNNEYSLGINVAKPGLASLVLDNINAGDLIAASSSGTTRFVVDNSGDVNIQAASSYSGSELTVGGTAPTVTIGDAGAEDTMLHFDGNAVDYHIGLDDTDDYLKIGTGTTLGTNTYLKMNSSGTIGTGTSPLTLTAGNWATITATGGAQFSSVSGAGLADCDDAVDVLKWDTTTKRFQCGSAVGQVKSFNDDDNVDSVVDDTTTNYWDVDGDSPQPNIALNDSTNTILIQASVVVSGANANDTQSSVRIVTSTSSPPSCSSGTQVGADFGVFLTTNNSGNVATYVVTRDPGSTSTQYFTICSSSETDLNTGSSQIERIDIVLSEVDNTAADIAELYPTNDSSLNIADLVGMDPDLKGGIKKASSSNNNTFLGAISTNPAKVIGGKGSAGINGLPVAIAGRVPVKITTINGNIATGSAITTGPIDGYGAKQITTSYIAGRSLEGTENWNVDNCKVMDNLSEIGWPEDNGSNQNKPCFAVPTETVPNVPSTYKDSYVYVGKVMMFVESGQYTPKDLVNNNSNLSVSLGANIAGVASESASAYLLHDFNGNIFENEQAFSSILSANGIFGSLTADTISTATISASTLNIGDINISNNSGIFSLNNSLNQSLLSLDSFGNATISGRLTTSGGNYDVAEDYPTRDMSLEPGDIVSVDSSESGFVVKSAV